MLALIIGRANTVWDDLNTLHEVLSCVAYNPPPMVSIAINGVGCDYAPVDHWASFHAELFPTWIKKRAANGLAGTYQLWTSSRGRRQQAEFEKNLGMKYVSCDGGSSAMVGALVAWEIGATHLVLCGCPLDANAGHYDEKGKWDEADMHRKAWEKLDPGHKETVRSMSGWTRQQFGMPDMDWLVKRYSGC